MKPCPKKSRKSLTVARSAKFAAVRLALARLAVRLHTERALKARGIEDPRTLLR
jgi:hypothetical protein